MTGGSNISALKTALAAAEARAANAEAKVSGAEAEIAILKLTIENLRREMYGWRFLTGNAPPPNSAPNTPLPSADAYHYVAC